MRRLPHPGVLAESGEEVLGGATHHTELHHVPHPGVLVELVFELVLLGESGHPLTHEVCAQARSVMDQSKRADTHMGWRSRADTHKWDGGQALTLTSYEVCAQTRSVMDQSKPCKSNEENGLFFIESLESIVLARVLQKGASSRRNP